MRKHRLVSLSLVVLLLLVAGAGGYLVGHGEAPTSEKAASTGKRAFRTDFKIAFKQSTVTGRKKGTKLGMKQGARSGHSAGATKGRSVGRRDSNAELARIAAEADAAQIASAEAARQIADYGSIIPGNIPSDAPSTCPPGYHFAAPATDICVPD